MGNSQSSSNSSSHGGTPSSSNRSRSSTTVGFSDQVVDGGSLEPLSFIYASSIADYSRPTVHKLIVERKLAPFHLGLNDYEDDWDLEQLLAALQDGERQASQNLRDAQQAAIVAVQEAEAAQLTIPPATRKSKEGAAAVASAVMHRERLAEVIKHRDKRGGGGLHGVSKTEQARQYQSRAIECPICFLYYPPPLVHTRCCDQPICTECFVQIKRAEPDATHLESEPAACPYCMEPNFGCVYVREPARPRIQTTQNSAGSSAFSSTEDGSAPVTRPKPRRKSFAHTEKEVVTTDQLHPDWEAKLEAVKATVARRAARRVVFRQVGDRLIPVGITSGRSGDGGNTTMSTTQLPPGFAAQVAAAMDASSASGNSRASRSSRRRNQEVAAYLQTMGVDVGQDLEEMMVEEAMRLSMLEDEERQKKEREEKEKAAKSNGDAVAGSAPVAETSAQGASRSTLDTPNTPHTTAALLSDAISAPMGSASLLDPSPSHPPVSLPSLPVLTPSPAPPVSGNRASPTAESQLSPPSAPPRLPSLDLSTPSTPLASIPSPIESNATLTPASAPTLQHSTPLAVTPSASSVTSSVSALSSVEDPLAGSAGYQQLEDDGEDDDDASVRERMAATSVSA